MNDQIKAILENANKIVVLQADNPDADSLGSALALEAILEGQGKSVALYCAVGIPDYLKYLPGWARVLQDMPKDFDASIIVDSSTKTLFEKSIESGEFQWLSTKPCIVLDHHAETTNDIEFAAVVCNEPNISSTCELIYKLFTDIYGPIPKDAFDPIMTGILGDTQGLTNPLAGANTYRIMSEMITNGANRPALEELRRQASKMHESIYRFKGEMIAKTELAAEDRLAMVAVDQHEINAYSPLYNPGPLIQGDMLQIEGVLVGIVFKVYDDGKITGMIRCNAGAEIANTIAIKFGGGGHGFAAGFKLTDGTSFSDVKQSCIAYVTELLDNKK